MKPRRCVKSKNRSEGKVAVVKYHVCTECSEPSCESCGIYRQMIEKPTLSYCNLLRKTTSENNILILKKMAIIAVSFLASLINFSRLADFKEEQLYLETVVSVLLYYSSTSNLTGATALLFGGLFHWFLLFGSRSKHLTVLVMTWLQVAVVSLRHYEWFAMAQHLFMSCVAIHIMTVLKSHYLKILLYCITPAYFHYMVQFGIATEDLFFCTVVVLANNYTTTSDPRNCYVLESIISLILWIGIKEIREFTGFSGLGVKLF